MASNFLSLNSSKTEFLLIGLPTQLAKIDNPSLSMPSSTSIKPVASARNLGVIFDSNLSFSDHISNISKTCFAHIRDLRRIRNTLDHTTACTIATSLIHSKLDYCNSLFLNLNCQQTNRLQLILNSTARAVTNASFTRSNCRTDRSVRQLDRVNGRTTGRTNQTCQIHPTGRTNSCIV